MQHPLKSQPEDLDDSIAFAEDDIVRASHDAGAAERPCWKILVVDDDDDVHVVTRLVLKDADVLGRPLDLIEATGLRDAQNALLRHPDIAVILLDVVMEEHDSGLRFARWVREAGLDDVRIILRTGQPGHAPELEVIRDYDINDYQAKNEMTRTRLITSLTGALRSYQQIHASMRTWRGLETIISSSSQLLRRGDLASFAQGVLLQIASLCGFRGDGMVCSVAAGAGEGEARIVAAIGSLSGFTGRRLADVPNDRSLKAATLNAIRHNTTLNDGPTILSVDASADRRFVISIGHDKPLDTIDSALLRMFVTSIAAGFSTAG